MTKTLLVTSALPYANGQLHLGHILEHIQTDIFVRSQRFFGSKCFYFCADDAHGTAIMLSAKQQNLSPENYISSIRVNHINDLKNYHIFHDDYYTTHSNENKELCEYFFKNMLKNGAVFKKEVSQYFCEDTGIFLADRYIKGTCPKCNAENQYGDSCEKCYATYSATELIDPISVLSGKTPILKTSEHYFFELEQFRNQVLEWLSTNPVSEAVKNKLNEWLKAPLKPWDISRDGPYFGFKIPESNNQYFYVWVDAPIGYIATSKHWCIKNDVNFSTLWENQNCDVHHFIGKDILYFHTLFWPAMLSTTSFNMPKKVHIHGFLTINGEKMSKSRGTFILAQSFLKKSSADSLRYYFAAKLSSSMEDIDLNITDFVNKINSDLLGKFINIGSRTGSILTKKLNGMLGTLNNEGISLLSKIKSYESQIKDLYSATETNKCMRLIMECAELTNKYIDSNAPWALVKTNKQSALNVCTTAINALRIISIYLSPVCPELTKNVFKFINDPEASWDTIDNHLENMSINPYTHLMQRLSEDDLNELFS